MAFDWYEIDATDRKFTVDDSFEESLCAITDAATYDAAIAVMATNGKINFIILVTKIRENLND